MTEKDVEINDLIIHKQGDVVIVRQNGVVLKRIPCVVYNYLARPNEDFIAFIQKATEELVSNKQGEPCD